MKYVLLFWGLMAIAYYVATKTKKYYDGTALAETLLVAVVVVLVFIMGMRMGSDQQVVDSIGDIGVLSVLISVVLWVGTFLAIWITRKAIRMDRYGQRLNATPVMEVAGDEISETAESPAEGSTDLMTVLILAGTLVGVLIGCFYIRTHFTVAELDLFDGISSDAMISIPGSTSKGILSLWSSSRSQRTPSSIRRPSSRETGSVISVCLVHTRHFVPVPAAICAI